jgi:para-nitrobenzyl esterase
MSIVPEPLTPGDEYLNLNVFTPALDSSLPVLVWVHGGGFVAGCNASPWYDGSHFARDGVVAVSISYRIGARGFLALRDAPPNRGLLDVIAALEWVRDNIAAFGGDPARVTIAGQSSGGAICSTLLTVPAAAGLFQQAICQSGFPNLVLEAKEAAEVAEKMASTLKLRPVREDFEALSAERLMQAQDALGPERPVAALSGLAAVVSGLKLTWAPWVDGSVLPQMPVGALAAGQAVGIPILAGAVVGELDMVLAGRRSITLDMVGAALEQIGESRARIDEYMRLAGVMPDPQLAGEVLTDRAFRLPARALAAAQTSAGGTVYLYDFRWAAPDGPFAGLSPHCIDIPFSFDNLDAQGTQAVMGSRPPQELADSMHGAWVRFITEGDPGWAPYGAQKELMVFDGQPRTEEDPLAS